MTFAKEIFMIKGLKELLYVTVKYFFQQRGRLEEKIKEVKNNEKEKCIPKNHFPDDGSVPFHGILFLGIGVYLQKEGWLNRLKKANFAAALLACSMVCSLSACMATTGKEIYQNKLLYSIDVAGLYNAEKSLFGVMDGGVLVTPCEYFAAHHWAIADIFAGIFYLCWVPVPILFGLCLYFKKERKTYLRFALVFLFVNLIGFAGYYIHPAAPPWYAINYGFEPILNTPGNVAGLGRFDAFFGVTIFDSIYGRNVNVFAAVPSLHAAYMVVALVYAIIGKCRWYVITLFSIIMVGIWGTAIYSCHHYIIDVLLGISCALIGWLVFEYVLMRIPAFKRFFERYYAYIK